MKKIILLLVSYILYLDSVFSQEIEWQNTIGGNSAEELTSLIQTSDGGFLFGGSSASGISGDKTEGVVGGTFQDYWVIKTDANGNFQWQNTIGGNSWEYLLAVAQAADGGYYIGGYSDSGISGDKTENNCSGGGTDYWVVKLDSAGNIQWDKTVGGQQIEWFTSMAGTADGGCILGGYSNTNWASCEKSENNLTSSFDFWVIKLDVSGNVQWDNTIGGNSTEKLQSIKQTADGGYICGAWSSSPVSGDKTEPSMGEDYWVVKLDSAGNIQWQNTIGGSGGDDLYSIAQTSDGGYICGGTSTSNISGDKTEDSYGGFDYWVVKLDAGGTVQWDKTIGGNDWNFLTSIAQTFDGGYICGGYSNSNSTGNKTENSLGGDDFWVVKLDSTGNIQSQNTFGGTSADQLNCIIQTSDGGYLCGGHSESPLSGDKSENGFFTGDYNYWVVKLTDRYNAITGKLFIDANSNGIKDTGEPTVRNKRVTETNTGRIAFSNQAGVYKVSVLDSGNFSVHPESINYYTAVPAAYAVNFSGIQQTDSLNDFAFQPAGVYNDLCLTLTSMGGYSPGFDANFMISYENVGTTTMNGAVILFPDSNLSFISSVPAPSSVTTDSIVWNFTSLTPFQSDNISVTLRVDSLTPIGTYITSSAKIEPVLGDANIECNNGFASGVVTGSEDPNAIIVDRDTVLSTELSNSPYLNYIIYFQNTGNDTAFNARVLNNIPQTLDLNSFEFVASSHPMNITYGAHSRLFTFTFDNILLPDSNINEPESHGFIRYRIKPKSTLVAGDQIKNNAAIYFDFNQPVMTDTAVTEIVLPTNLTPNPSPKERGVALAPNPATDELTISVKPPIRGGLVVLHIFDLYGREVFQLQTSNFKPQTQINVSRFSEGIYFVELQSGEQVLRGKFLKE